MIFGKRAVAVMKFPELWRKKEARTFSREIERRMDVTRPFLVLDCSNVRHLDKPVIEVLLGCLEEAMKRNGDVKLAGLPLTADAILGSMGANRLFEIFDTTVDAVNSFHQPAFDNMSETEKSESAA